MKDLIQQLQQADAYSHEVNGVKVIQTAVSVVFLTGDVVYKICKPVNFGFLDYSTLDKRHTCCVDEVEFNKLISPELYLGVVEIRKIGERLVVDGNEGEVVEYAIKMKQCNPDTIMSNQLDRGLITEKHIIELANRIFSFHSKAPTSEDISQYGSIENVTRNTVENFDQTRERFGNSEEFKFIEEKSMKFIEENKGLFEVRIAENKIKHCHGDLHSGNIFVEEDKIIIFDGIVFNKRFPCSDVIADIATTLTDLDFHEKNDFSKLLINKYKELSGEENIDTLLNFYKCYRAVVKFKINGFMLGDEHVPEEDKIKIKDDAEKYVKLAYNYAKLF
jgi:uncharacterized protein